jgi:predicted permease
MLVMLALLSLCVLLVACANVAGLLLSRASIRAREFAVRQAIGARRAALVRQLLVENLLLAMAGGAVGLVVAYAGVKLFNSVPPPPSDLPLKFETTLDSRVLLFTAAVSLLSTLVFGLLPALQTTRLDLVPALKAADGASSKTARLCGRHRLVGGQVALSLVLLIVSGVLIEGFRAQLTQGPGFRTDHLFLMRFDTSLLHYAGARNALFYKQLLDMTRLAPDVKSAAFASVVPMTIGGGTLPVVPEGYPLKRGQKAIDVFDDVVSEGYFETMGIRVVQGRDFLESDTANTTPIAIVNEQFARHYWPGQNPLGKRFHLQISAGKLVEVVGVAKTTKHIWLTESRWTSCTCRSLKTSSLK